MDGTKNAAAEEAASRIVFRAEWRQKWLDLLEKKGIQQQETIQRLIVFLLDQDDLLQSAILGTVDLTDDLMEVMLKRLRARPSSAQRVGKPDARSTKKSKALGASAG